MSLVVPVFCAWGTYQHKFCTVLFTEFRNFVEILFVGRKYRCRNIGILHIFLDSLICRRLRLFSKVITFVFLVRSIFNCSRKILELKILPTVMLSEHRENLLCLICDFILKIRFSENRIGFKEYNLRSLFFKSFFQKFH